MNITILGATGFLGEPLLARLYKGNKITALARNEGKLIALKEKYPNIRIITGDVIDWVSVSQSIKGADEVYYLAAYKHVGLAEEQPTRCVLSNVVGTLTILKAVQEYKPKLLVGISTDKAAQVNGVYGATKFLMEKLFEEAERLNPKTKYRIVRYGNVLYSTGSVLCKWKDKMQKGEGVMLSDPDMTRFFWTIDEALDHIFEAVKKQKNCKPFIPKMKAMRMGNLLKAMMKKYGEVPVKQIGIQPGDNRHETVDGVTFSNKAEQYTVQEISKLI